MTIDICRVRAGFLSLSYADTILLQLEPCPDPSKSWTDKLLACFGRRRAVYVPDAESRFGPHVYAKARKEPFLRALFRRKNAPIPDGWIYSDAGNSDVRL